MKKLKVNQTKLLLETENAYYKDQLNFDVLSPELQEREEIRYHLRQMHRLIYLIWQK